MKSKKILLLEAILRFMASAVLKRHKPDVVAITGSVGKTSAKSAIFEVLSSKFEVRENQKNYNNEIGIPLTIIGAESGGGNVFKWALVFIKWISALISPSYPKILVLELGVDRPGDMEYFMSFIKPVVSVVTNVSHSHMEFFNSIENIAKEKEGIIRSLKEDDFAILNFDDELVTKMQKNTKAGIISFGLNQDSTINASSLAYNYQENRPTGISFKLNFEGKNVPIRLKNILAGHFVYAALVAAATGVVFKMNLVEISQALENLKSPTGRMNLLEGINGSFIIDDTYNASPVSTIAALGVLSELKSSRKIAVLGDMLELGTQSELGHREVGRKIFDSKVDIFVFIGRRMEDAVKELIAKGFPARSIMKFEQHSDTVNALRQIIKKDDFVLVKGSQGMRMEKIVEGILSEKLDPESYLCRQSEQWKSKAYLRP